jgi:MATE family multidrug resistance protein
MPFSPPAAVAAPQPQIQAQPEGQAQPPTQPQTLGHHIRRTVALAVPVMLARAGLIIMLSVNTAMIGQSAATELAFYSVSMIPHTTLLVTGVGLLIGTVVLTAQAVGAGRPNLTGRIWRLALIVAGGLGIASGLVMLVGEPILLLLGQPAHLAAGGGRLLVLFAPGMPAVLMFAATTSFLEGIGRPNAGMVIALAANLVNGGLNWVLIYGNLGAPAMGADGAVIATTVTRWLMLAAIVLYTLTMRGRDRYGVRAPLRGHFHQIGKLLRMGTPLAVGTALETTAFSAMATFAGWLGDAEVAAYTVTLNFVTLSFMMTVGISTATAVRVANAVGRGDRRGLLLAGWVGTGLVVAVMLVLAMILALWPEAIAGVYTGDPAVRVLVVAAFAVAAPLLIVDGLQGVLMGAVRGAADVFVPTWLHAVSFWIVTVPLGYALGVALGHGVTGLMWALLIGLVLASLLLGGRFHVISRRHIRPV